VNRKIKKSVKYAAVAAVFVCIAYLFPIPLGVLLLCGVWDVSRNRALDPGVFRQYFFKNGVGTWLASPVNILMDILALPYTNKGVYELSDLPRTYQTEITGILETADDGELVGRLEQYMAGASRAMVFFKWYGTNVSSPVDMPEFHAEYRFVRTIGVSGFKERESTSRHFGPFRPCLRVLYCLNKDVADGAFIRVGSVENHWKDNPIFIFDDTLLHQSFNETDAPRYCLWLDIIRPSYIPFVFDFAVTLIRLTFMGIHGVFYKNWRLINN
jgi:beta-hydroxylase